MSLFNKIYLEMVLFVHHLDSRFRSERHFTFDDSFPASLVLFGCYQRNITRVRVCLHANVLIIKITFERSLAKINDDNYTEKSA